MTLLETRLEPFMPIGEIFTAECLQELPSEARYELIRGELCTMPNNSAEHGSKTARLSGRVIPFVEDNELGECFIAETRFTIEENPDTVLAPDFAFIKKERLEGIPPKGYLRMAPDLVVETRSPSDTRTEFVLKISRWLQAGSQVVWALEPANQTLVVHRTGVLPRTLTIEDTLTEEELLPGFLMALSELFLEI